MTGVLQDSQRRGKCRPCWSCLDYFDFFLRAAFGFNTFLQIARPEQTPQPCRRTRAPNPGPSTKMIMSYTRWLVCDPPACLDQCMCCPDSLTMGAYPKERKARPQLNTALKHLKCEARRRHLLSVELGRVHRFWQLGDPGRAVLWLGVGGMLSESGYPPSAGATPESKTSVVTLTLLSRQAVTICWKITAFT